MFVFYIIKYTYHTGFFVIRFLVTSMQSIGLECFDGENMVDIRLQETTFIHHTFGGRLRSKANMSSPWHLSDSNCN